MLYVIGDSHSTAIYQNDRTRMRAIWLGPVTMARVANTQDETLSSLSLSSLKDSDSVGFIFGEIDVRFHVKNRSAFLKVSPEKFLQDISRGYVKKVVERAKNVSTKNVGIFSVPPPIYYDLYQVKNEISGTDEERRGYVSTLNVMLEHECNKSGVAFANIHQFFVDKSGMMDPMKSDAPTGPNDSLGFKCGCGIHPGAGESDKIVSYLKTTCLL